MTRRTSIALSTAFAAGAAVLRLPMVPSWYADAQYYVQAGRLWQSGQVTFAGHLVGGRHLAIWYYQTFQNLFGPSADAVTMALAVAFALAAALVVLLCHLVIAGAVPALVTSAILVSALALMPIWNSALTDPLLLVVVLSALALSALGVLRPRWSIGLLGVVGALCGLGTGIRPESILLAGSAGLSHALSRSVPPSRRAAGVALAAVMCWAGSAVQTLLWASWVPVNQPDAYRSAFAFYLPLYYLGDPSHGPASAAIDRLEASAGLPLTTEHIGLFPVMAAGARSGAVGDTDRQVLRAGLELLRHDPFGVAAQFFREGWAYFSRPPLALQLSGDGWGDRWTFLRDRLHSLDERREATSVAFGNDAWWHTETLADRHVGWLQGVRERVPSWSAALSLPAALIPLSLLAVAIVMARRRQVVEVLLAPSLFVLASWAVTSFSQGYSERYSETWRFLALLVVSLALAVHRAAAPAQALSPNDRVL